jgi:hypothetical protein
MDWRCGLSNRAPVPLKKKKKGSYALNRGQFKEE